MHFRVLVLTLCAFALFAAGCSDLTGGETFNTSELDGEDLDEVIAEGMIAWRKTGTIMEGAACANCHAPDAIDLAYFDFEPNTIRRRAKKHTGKLDTTLGNSDINKIIRLVKAKRAKYDIEPRDHMNDRPFQPGGSVLAGQTASDRDLAFGQQLRDKGYRFANVAILDEKEALRQRDEWLNLDLRKMRIGIPLNRWSEDPHHGVQHASMADWLPDLPRVPKEERAEEWYEVHDTYLGNPTDENLRKLLEAEKRMARSIYDGNSRRFFHEKYRSALVAQHLFRKEITGENTFTERSPSASISVSAQDSENPVWEVGMMAHAYRKGNVGTQDFQIPNSVREGLHPSETIADNMHRIRVPWFYVGWMLDQGLQHSGQREATKSGRYFTLHMHIDDGYPIHNIFMISRKIIVQNFGSGISSPDESLKVDYDNFNNYEFAETYEPEGKEAKDIYRFITENSYRMMLFLIQKEITNNGLPSGSSENEEIVEEWRETIDDFEAFTEHAETEHYEFNLQLVSETRKMLSN